jgi:hypothetical protein
MSLMLFRGSHGNSYYQPHKARWNTEALTANDDSEAIQR